MSNNTRRNELAPGTLAGGGWPTSPFPFPTHGLNLESMFVHWASLRVSDACLARGRQHFR
jgi:hypothetical protein